MSDPLNVRDWFKERDEHINALLDAIEAYSAERPVEQIGPKEYQQGFVHHMSRAQTAEVIRAVLGCFEARAGTIASAYADMAVYRALGIDFDASNIVMLKGE